MGFNRDDSPSPPDQLDAMGVRIRWAGRRPKLWRSVIRELEEAEEQSRDNTVLTLQFCVNYGGRAEIVDAARAIAKAARAGRLDPDHLTEKSFRKFLDEPDIPDVDLFVRSSGEQRTSNFLVWQSAYAEMVFPRPAVARFRPSRPVAGDRAVRLRDLGVTAARYRTSSVEPAADRASRGP